MERLALTFSDRADIAAGLRAGQGVREIARDIGRDPSVVSREIRRNKTRTRGYRPVFADCAAERRRHRPQTRLVDADPVLGARVRADLRRSRTPRQVARRLRLEASDASVGLMPGSLPADGKTISHEAIYQWIYALPKGELAREGIILRSARPGAAAGGGPWASGPAAASSAWSPSTTATPPRPGAASPATGNLNGVVKQLRRAGAVLRRRSGCRAAAPRGRRRGGARAR